MKANELRLGNLVSVDNANYHSDLEGVTLSVIGINQILDTENKTTYTVGLEHVNKKANTYYETYAQFIKYIKPIPLTEEWLIKFGKSPINANGTVEFDRFKLIYKEAYGYWYVMDNLKLTYLTKIEFIHEWQNFYYIMNGEELCFTA